MNVFIAEINGQTADLRPDESWHCAKVLRKKIGDTIYLIDGLGSVYSGVLDLVTDKKCKASVTGIVQTQPAPNYYLHLAIAPTKNIDRIEWMLEKCVEIGIQEISFFISKNSERQIIKMDRMRSIVESAVKQSLQARIPLLNQLVTLSELVEKSVADQKLIAHCHPDEKTELRAIDFRQKKTLVLVGPEGDFTPAEASSAMEKGFKPVSLGPNRLRTETAGLYVCQTASIVCP